MERVVYMDWTSILSFIFFLSLFVVIGLLLISLAKHGDERKELIKTKTITYTFSIVIGLIIINIIKSIYLVFAKGMEAEGINSFILLVTISVVFLITLLYNKKKYGD